MRRALLALALAVAATSAVGQKGGAGKTPTLTPLAWYDSTGKLVGMPSFGTSVLARVGDDVLHVALTQAYGYLGDLNAPYGSYVAQGGGVVYFNGNNCTGQAYIVRNDLPGTTRASAIVVDSNNVVTAYYAVSPPVATMATFSSVLDNTPATCRAIGETSMKVPVAGSAILSGLWTPPFYLK